jgi:decaprenylphospho-beta-D-ribofuranose 2-oxidase
MELIRVIPHATQELSGWGSTHRTTCSVYRPESLRGLRAVLADADEPHFIARGLGRSYGDTSVNDGGGVVLGTRLNRMLSFDADSGVVTCEGGVGLDELIEHFLPRGWFLPVTPGTKFVTVGGAIANDVHGKNHHRDGTFSNFVAWFDLMLADGSVMRCSREENADAFWATAGGAGLTGIILAAEIQLLKVETGYMKLDFLRAKDFDAIMSALDTSDQDYRYSVAWVDALARGAKLGRSVLANGDHALKSDLPSRMSDPLRVPKKRKFTVPFEFPGWALNPMGLRLFNETIYRTHPSKQGDIADYDRYFYPLDFVHHWNRMYGKRGFTQYQAAFPPDQAEGIRVLLEKLSSASMGSYISVLKRFGPQGEGYLSFPFEGYTISLDLPFRKGSEPLLDELDRLVLDRGGRLYLAKDVATKPDIFQAMYPRLDAFREVKAKLDPDGRFSSRQARRLGLCPNGVAAH